jgi:hypothetical protein
VNAFFAFNWENKEETTPKEDPVLSQLPFIQGAQVYIPASSPPNATVSYQLNSPGSSDAEHSQLGKHDRPGHDVLE